MRVEATAVTIGLDTEESLRVEQGTMLDVVCLSGVVWITLEGDLRDLFLAPGESMLLERRGMALITALEPSAVKVHDNPVSVTRRARAWSNWTSGDIRSVLSRWRSRAVLKLCAPSAG